MLACRGHQRVFINNVKACREGKKGSDMYLSYLSAPPLLCCCSSQWNPVKDNRWTQWDRRVGGRERHRDITGQFTGCFFFLI